METEKTQPVQLHTSCSTLYLKPFIQAYCNKDFTGLIISGVPTAEQIAEAWEEILFEYSTLIKNDNTDYFFTVTKQISLLQWHINFVNHATFVLHYRHEPEIIEGLRKLGYSIKSAFGTEEYHDRLNMIVSLCKTRYHDLEDLQIEYDRMQNTASKKDQT